MNFLCGLSAGVSAGCFINGAWFIWIIGPKAAATWALAGAAFFVWFSLLSPFQETGVE